MKLFLTLIKSMLNIALLGILLIGIAYWINIGPDGRTKLIEGLDSKVSWDLMGTTNKFRESVRSTVSKSENPLLQESLKLLDESFGKQGMDIHILDPDCRLPETSEKQTRSASKIYRWRDEHGNIHFSDTPVSDVAEDLSQKYAQREDYIDTRILDFKNRLPLDSNTKIKTGIRKMFSILSDALRVEQLKQLELVLKVFGDSQAFQQYLSRKAPRLKQAAGFYLPLENEAVVMAQRHPEQTLSLIRHESSHVMMANIYGASPLWLNEGFAEYFRYLKISGLESSVYPNTYALSLLKRLTEDSQYRISAHFDLKPKQWQGNKLYKHYAEAWSLVYFLLSSEKGKSALGSYLEALSEDRCQIPDSKQFFGENYPGGLTQLDKEWRKWLSQYKIHPHRY